MCSCSSILQEVNLTEFAIKLAKICTVRAESPLTIRGISSVRSRNMRNAEFSKDAIDDLYFYIHIYALVAWTKYVYFADLKFNKGKLL